MAEKEMNAPAPAEKPPERAENVVPPNWGPNMLVYGDISRTLFRMHRNVAAHMEAHKRLAERMQTVFAHEQAMVLELARMIDESLAGAARKSNEEKPRLGNDSIERIFDHAGNAMRETGRMLSDIQLESLALLRQYIAEPTEAGAKRPETSATKPGSGTK